MVGTLVLGAGPQHIWAVPVQTLEDFTSEAVRLMAADSGLASVALEELESDEQRRRLATAIAEETEGKGKAPAQAMQPVQAPMQVHCRGC